MKSKEDEVMPWKMVSGLREEMIDPPGFSRFLGIDLVD
jgi:hypothetical protein